MHATFSRRSRTRALLVSALMVCAISIFNAVPASAATSAAGSVNFMRTAEGSFDTFTANPTVAQQQWMKAHYWRMRAYAPYFDTRLSWASKAWAYQSAYAIYPGSTVDVQHPEWILRDAAGNKLYIPFACSGGKCSQYAADIGNPAYRQWWLDQSRAKLAKGYAGLYFDDVNLYRKVSNGSGVAVAPIDPRTGAAMSEPTWQRYLADQMQAARTAFPTTELIHNAIWFAGDTTADQLRVHRAANLINLERGINDPGLTGGTGKWSFQALLSFIDHRQAEGHGVVFDATSTTAAGRMYGLAAYFLISSDRDGLGNNQGGTPTDWWTGYDVDLGAPLAGRYSWNGLVRRDFANGYTLVNEPGATTRTVTLPAGSKDLTGTARTSVTLTAASGAVYTTAPVAAPTPTPTPTPTPSPTPTPGPTTAGHVNFTRTAGGSFDVFTSSPTVAQQDWMKAHYWRMRAYAPYFDSRLSWAPKTWAYQSAYGVVPGSSVDTQHPDWILHDAAGNKLYLPSGCSGGKCAQYAADIGNPSYRQWWLDQARANLAKGYAGLYIDNVSLYRKVSNGSGVAVDPIDPRTGTVLTEPTWQRYLADEMEAARSAFPTTEIVHNAIWFAGDTTADQLRVQRAANLINLERGVNDTGVTGGTGKWSLQSLLAFADHRQAEGHGIVLDAASTTAAGRLYGLAAYFLVSSGRDGLGNDQGGTPSDWWTGYDVDLGAPLAGRYSWNGLIRRDFANGYTLVNEPGAPSRTVTLPAGSRDLTGASQTSQTLTAASGAVFTTTAR
jgi:hypothetical protein